MLVGSNDMLRRDGIAHVRVSGAGVGVAAAFKDCPACGATVAADRAGCVCGHDFTANPKALGKKSRGEKRREKVTARRGGGVWLAIVAVVAAAAVLVFLAFPGSSSVGLGVASFMLYRLARRVEDLEAEVADLRAELGHGPSAREG